MWIILFCRAVINGGTRIVRCEVLTVVVVKTAVFLDVVLCSMVYISTILNHITSQKMAAFSTRLFIICACY
jgi:hypothetical protein